MINVAVLGGGSWGSAFSLHLARKGIPVRLWIREKEIFEEAQRTRSNKTFLPGFLFPPAISFYNSLPPAVESADIVFIAVPSSFCRSIYKELMPFLSSRMTVVSLTKGIEEETHKRMTEIMQEIFPARVRPRVAVLSGPSFAREVAQGLPTAVVVGSRDPETAQAIQHLVSDNSFRAYTGQDVIGIELAGAVKNIIAIAAGISDALENGTNSRAALITRGLTEMIRLGEACGARRETFFGLAGLGDLILTCTGELSRNRHIGWELGKGKKLTEVLSGMAMVAEGVGTARSVFDLALKLGVDMPICEQVYLILYHEKDPRKALHTLMSRRLKEE